MNSSPGRLMHNSVISGDTRKGRKGRSISSSDETSPAVVAPTRLDASACIGGRPQFIHRTEIEIPCDQNLDAIAVLLAHRRRNIHGALEDFCHDIGGVARVVDD